MPRKTMPIEITSFKAYDVRGQIPGQLNADVCYRIGNATAEYLGAGSVVLCRDIRHSSDELSAAVARGLTEAGCDVLDIGVGGTEMVYFGTSELGADGGIMVTASHNPADYNGLKMVRAESKPISGDTGLDDIRKIAERDERLVGAAPGEHRHVDVTDDYIAKPFLLEELILRIHGIFRRQEWYSSSPDEQEVFRFSDNEVNFLTYEAKTGDRVVNLTEKECMLMKLLVERKNQVVSREEILERVWGYRFSTSSRTIDNFIAHFRKLFEDDPKSPKHFHTLRGVGYRFEP